MFADPDVQVAVYSYPNKVSTSSMMCPMAHDRLVELWYYIVTDICRYIVGAWYFLYNEKNAINKKTESHNNRCYVHLTSNLFVIYLMTNVSKATVNKDSYALLTGQSVGIR